MNNLQKKIQGRARRHARVRATISGTTQRPRLVVFRANQHIYAQIIDDTAHKTLVSASSLASKAKGTKTEQAVAVGTSIAQKALAANITEVVFDRGGYQYHGRVKALADAAREAGLKF